MAMETDQTADDFLFVSNWDFDDSDSRAVILEPFQCDCHGFRFAKKADLTRHVAKETRRFECEVKHCPSSYANGDAPVFGTFNDKKRHYRDVNGVDMALNPLPRYTCPWKNCRRHIDGFPRPKNLENHLKSLHDNQRPDTTTEAITSSSAGTSEATTQSHNITGPFPLLTPPMSLQNTPAVPKDALSKDTPELVMDYSTGGETARMRHALEQFHRRLKELDQEQSYLGELESELERRREQRQQTMGSLRLSGRIHNHMRVPAVHGNHPPAAALSSHAITRHRSKSRYRDTGGEYDRGRTSIDDGREGARSRSRSRLRTHTGIGLGAAALAAATSWARHQKVKDTDDHPRPARTQAANASLKDAEYSSRDVLENQRQSLSPQWWSSLLVSSDYTGPKDRFTSETLQSTADIEPGSSSPPPNPGRDRRASLHATLPSTFPVLGSSYKAPIQAIAGLQSDHAPSNLGIRASKSGSNDASLESTTSEISSSDWTDQEQDTKRLQVTNLSTVILLRKYFSLVHGHGPIKQHQQTGQQSQHTEKNVEQDKPSQASRGRQRKRQANQGPDENQADEESRRPKRRQTKANKNDATERALACPFNKYDNMLFGPDSPEESYHGCATCSFVHIAHLKQHLQRNHYLPPYYCFRCYRRNFASHAMVAAHLREEPVCEIVDPPLYGERIGSDLIEELGLDRKNSLRTDRVEYWYRMYNAFFPGAIEARRPTPYYDGPAAEHLNRFLEFSAHALHDLLPLVQRRLNISEEVLAPDPLRLIQDIQQEAGERYLQRLRNVSMPRLGRTVPPSSEPIHSGRQALDPTGLHHSLASLDLVNSETPPDRPDDTSTSPPAAAAATLHTPRLGDNLFEPSATAIEVQPEPEPRGRADAEMGEEDPEEAQDWVTIVEPASRHGPRVVDDELSHTLDFYPGMDLPIDWQAEVDKLLDPNPDIHGYYVFDIDI